MKIVQIEDFFHPHAGYQINILSKYWAKQGHEVIIITSMIDRTPSILTDFFEVDNIEKKDFEYFQETGIKVIRVPIYKYVSGRAIYKLSILKVVDELEPDILYIHGNDTFIGIIYSLRLRKLGYPVIFDNHMLDMASKNRFNKIFYYFYKTFITPILIKNDVVVIRTVEDGFVNIRYNIPLSNSPVIGFGSDLLSFKPDEITREMVRNSLGIMPEEFVIVYAGKLDESKGGEFLADCILEQFDASKDVVFLIIGSCFGENCSTIENKFEKSNNRIIRLPTQQYDKLPQYYQCSDLAIFPKQCSLSFYNVQACGLPVVLEENKININRVKAGNGICFKENSVSSFRDSLKSIIDMDHDKYTKMKSNSIRYIQKNYDYDNVVNEYNNIIFNEIKSYGSKITENKKLKKNYKI